MLCTVTADISSSSENINSMARVSRLSSRFLWLWKNVSREPALNFHLGSEEKSALLFQYHYHSHESNAYIHVSESDWGLAEILLGVWFQMYHYEHQKYYLHNFA